MENLLICGGNSIIAQEFLHKYKKSYNKIVLLDKKYSGIKQKENIVFIESDLSSKKDLQNVRKYFLERNIKIQQMLFIAGVNNMNDFFSETLEDWDYTMKNNLNSFFYCMKFFYDSFSKRSSVLVVSSQNGVVANYNRIDYGPSKAALIHLVKNLTLDIDKDQSKDLKINSISPGIVINKKNENFLNSPSYINQKQNKSIKFVPVSDVINTIYILLDNNIRSFRGANIIMDNGYTL